MDNIMYDVSSLIWFKIVIKQTTYLRFIAKIHEAHALSPLGIGMGLLLT